MRDGTEQVYLLDTHALVWGVTAPERLPLRVRDLLAAGQGKASVVSYWELMLKKAGRPYWCSIPSPGGRGT